VTPPPAPASPCPRAARLGQSVGFNHSNLPAASQTQFRTYLGALTRIELSPTDNYSGSCVREEIVPFGNTCPAQVTNASSPCSGHDCLPVGRAGSDAATGTSLGGTNSSFLDLHRTRNAASLLEGTGLSSCSYSCYQRYYCNRTPRGPAIGEFILTRNFRADTFTPQGGRPMHITTGEVVKTDLSPPPTEPGDYPLRVTPEGTELA